MTIRKADYRTKADCDKGIARKMKALAEVRRKLQRDNTPHVRAGLIQEEHTLKEDIQTLKSLKAKLKN